MTPIILRSVAHCQFHYIQQVEPHSIVLISAEEESSDSVEEEQEASSQELEDIAFSGYENAYGEWDQEEESSTSQSLSSSESTQSGTETSSTSSIDLAQMMSL